MAMHPKSWVAEYAVISEPVPFEAIGTDAVVDICGPLEQHAGWFCDSYDAIRDRVAHALASSATRVVLRINSPGGDFAGAIELAKEIRAAALATGKPVVTFTDSQALSAGYILACAASEIFITPSAFVGSIGVWAPLVDETMRDKAMGLNIAIVASGARKADHNPHVSLTEGAVTALQTQVDEMAGMFFAHVAECRPMALAAIQALEGAEQFGANAVALQLADHIVQSWGDFLTFTSTTKSGNEDKPMAKSFDEALAKAKEALAKCAEGDDEDAKAANAMLAKMGDDAEEKKDEPKKEEAAAASDKPEEKAAGEEDDKKAAARGGLRLVASVEPSTLDLAARLHALESANAAKALSEEIGSLLASRPDITGAPLATLKAASLAQVKDAVKNWPKGSLPNPVAKAAATATRGAGVGENQAQFVDANGMPKGFIGQSEDAFVESRMNKSSSSTPIVNEGAGLSFGFMSKADAAAHLAKLTAAKGGVK